MDENRFEPEWIRRRNQDRAEVTKRAEMVALKNKSEEALMDGHSAQFCMEFLRQLESNLGYPTEVSSSLSAGATPETGPQIYMVTLRGTAPEHRMLTVRIQFLKPRADDIRILLFGAESVSIRLAPLWSGDGVGAVLSTASSPVAARQLAELLAEDWVKRVCPEPQ